MSEEKFKRSVVTLQNLTAANVLELIDRDSLKQDCHRYQFIFEQALKEADEAEVARIAGLKFLIEICSLRLNPGSSSEPLSHLWEFEGGRSVAVQDFSREEISLLQEVYPDFGNPEIRARMADIVWLRTRSREAAREAVRSYKESAELPREFFRMSVERLRRAIQIAKSQNDRNAVKEMVDGLMTRTKELEQSGEIYSAYEALGMLKEERLGDWKELIELCERCAKHSENAGDAHWEHQWWLLRRDWALIGKDQIEAKRSLLAAAECYVRLGVVDGSESGLLASSHFEKAIELLRTVSGTKDRVAEIHQLLLEAQRRSLSEMKEFSSPSVDISSTVVAATEAVRGKTFEEGLRVLGQDLALPSLEEIRRGAIKEVEEHPLSHIIGGSIVSQSGKRVASLPSIVEDGEEGVEAAVYRVTLRHVKIWRELATRSLIRPMSQEIFNSHSFSASDLLPLLSANPFVPIDRRQIYAKGLSLGLMGDAFSASHILIPQIENSLRYLLEKSGEITNSLSSDLVQDEWSINQILDHPRIAAVIGSEVLVLILKEFLVEKQSENLRNKVCHGLLADDSLNSLEHLFAWWLALFLCSRFEYRGVKAKSDPEKVGDE